MSIVINHIEADSEELRRAKALDAAWAKLDALPLLRQAIDKEFIGKITLSSSFGADSAALLHLVAQIDPHLPIVFLDTDRHFFRPCNTETP